MIDPDTYLIPLLTAFLGFFVGNKLAIGRDKRKEFNEVAIPIRTSLIRQLEALQAEKQCFVNISTEDRVVLECYISRFKIKGFRKAVAEYKIAQQKYGYQDRGGQFIICDTSGYVSATSKLLQYVKPK